MLDDLCGRPLPFGSAFPVAIAAAAQRTEHECWQPFQPTTTFHPTRHAGNLRVNLLRRHPIATALAFRLLVTAFHPLPPLVDAITGSAPGDVDLDRPTMYVALAPLSNTLDALTFFSAARAAWAVVVWVLVLAAWGALRAGTRRPRVVRALAGAPTLLVMGVAKVFLPRPVPRLPTTDSGPPLIGYHRDHAASHDLAPTC